MRENGCFKILVSLRLMTPSYESTTHLLSFFLPVDTANALSPSPIPSHTDMPKGNPGAGKPPKIAFDTAKASKIFGHELKYRSMEETTRDTLEDFERRGW